MDKKVTDILKRISLKKVKTFNGHDGIGLDAEVYFDKIKVAQAFDGAYGGEMEFQLSNIEKYRELEDIIQALPVIELYPEIGIHAGGKPLMGKPDLAWMIDHILAEKENEKFNKKLEKDFLTKICFGVPNGKSYASYDLKKPLVVFSTKGLQTFIDTTVKPKLKEGEVILNTNLKEMGLIF